MKIGQTMATSDIGARLKSLFTAVACATTLAFVGTRWAAAADEPTAIPEKPSLRVGSLNVGKILFLGNSITLHGPSPDIGWLGNWGMAASAEDKDYVHLLVGRIAGSAKGKPQFMVKNIADFERRLEKYDLAAGLEQELAFQPDVVIVAIGENAAALDSDEAKTRFAAAFAGLLAELRRHGQPAVFVRSSFWADPPKDEIMERAAHDAGATFVDIQKLGKQEANFARSERQIQHAGVAGHPGDQGMQALADALWDAIQRRRRDQAVAVKRPGLNCASAGTVRFAAGGAPQSSTDYSSSCTLGSCPLAVNKARSTSASIWLEMARTDPSANSAGTPPGGRWTGPAAVFSGRSSDPGVWSTRPPGRHWPRPA